MSVSALVVMAAAMAQPVYQPDRPIASRAVFPAAIVDDVRRPGFNGRPWITRPVIGGTVGPWAISDGTPGREAYGASPHAGGTVWARVGNQVIGLDPYQRLDRSGLQRLENARNFWLREQGLVGGVRTFVNDLYVKHDEHHAAADSEPSRDAVVSAPEAAAERAPIVPRATIRVPAEMPRRQPRIRVMTDQEWRDAVAALPADRPGVTRVVTQSADAPPSVASAPAKADRS